MDVLMQRALGARVDARLRGTRMHAPAHVDAEVLSALGRLHRAGSHTEEQASERLRRFARMPIVRFELRPLLPGAWARRHNVALKDALYVELAQQLDLRLLTTDRRLAAATSVAELIE